MEWWIIYYKELILYQFQRNSGSHLFGKPPNQVDSRSSRRLVIEKNWSVDRSFKTPESVVTVTAVLDAFQC